MPAAAGSDEARRHTAGLHDEPQHDLLAGGEVHRLEGLARTGDPAVWRAVHPGRRRGRQVAAGFASSTKPSTRIGRGELLRTVNPGQ